MSYYGWKPYVPVAKRRASAERAAAKARKSGQDMKPVAPIRGAVARTFWGKAWCDNLEGYGDFANRLPRGRTYVRNGSVIDLQIGAGAVRAQVMGSSLYRVEVAIVDVAKRQWERIAADCAGSIDTLVELLQGKLSKAVMERISRPRDGLFPGPKEIDFKCSCPDWASMCKHVAAVLYGIGNRLDQQPELLFTLRGVDAADLIANAGSGIDSRAPPADADKVLDGDALADVFGIELASVPATPPASSPSGGGARTPRQTKVKTSGPVAPAVATKSAKAPVKTPAKETATAKNTAAAKPSTATRTRATAAKKTSTRK